MTTCSCELNGFCTTRNRTIAIPHQMRCRQGHYDAISQLYEKFDKRADPPPLRVEAVATPQVSTIGTHLAAVIKREVGAEISCSDCRQDVLRLNSMTSKQVIADIDNIVNRMYPRAKLLAPKAHQRAGARLFPNYTKSIIKDWIMEAVKLHEIEQMKAQPNRIVCGDIHPDDELSFMSSIGELMNGVEMGSTLENGRRRVVATQGGEIALRRYLENWNKQMDERRVRPPVWCYGLTTVPSRIGLLRETLKSLSAAGFPEPVLFVDSDHLSASLYAEFGLPVVFRGSNLKPYRHWFLSLLELFLRSHDSDYYAMFQDDMLILPDTKEYIEKSGKPKDGYFNLFTFMGKNEEIISNAPVGWTESDQCGRGGLALVFDNDCVVTLMTSEHMYDRMHNPDRCDKFLDGAVVTALNKAGVKEYIHNPSLVQHTGEISVAGNGSRNGNRWGGSNNHPHSLSFPGTDVSALTFLKKNDGPSP